MMFSPSIKAHQMMLTVVSTISKWFHFLCTLYYSSLSDIWTPDDKSISYIVIYCNFLFSTYSYLVLLTYLQCIVATQAENHVGLAIQMKNKKLGALFWVHTKTYWSKLLFLCKIFFISLKQLNCSFLWSHLPSSLVQILIFNRALLKRKPVILPSFFNREYESLS